MTITLSLHVVMVMILVILLVLKQLQLVIRVSRCHVGEDLIILLVIFGQILMDVF
nr:MAG TPA: hypothetical protein [Bacteriophage sp.]